MVLPMLRKLLGLAPHRHVRLLHATQSRPQRRFETLESRRMLAIVWVNEGNENNDSDDFNQYYGANAAAARQIVHAAINDWNAVVTDFNFSGSEDFELLVEATPLASGF